VKFKVFVTDADTGFWNSDDDIDGFVKLLRLTPALNVSTANWIQITIRGIRSSDRTRYLFIYQHRYIE